MRAQLGVFYSLYRHFQLQFQAPGEAPGFSPIRNASGTTTLYGVEAEAQAVFGALSFDLGGSFNHSVSRLSFVSAVDPVQRNTNRPGRPSSASVA